jgi:hypothetical protein
LTSSSFMCCLPSSYLKKSLKISMW